MGRKPYRNTGLPPGMRKRVRRARVYYYLDTGEKPRREIPLGSDYVLAVKEWSRLTAGKTPPSGEITFAYVAQKYWEEIIPSKKPRTQSDNEKERAKLLQFFNDPPAPLDTIEPVHIRQYMRWRVQNAREEAQKKNEQRAKEGKTPLPVPAGLGQVRANREKALFSHIWNFARSEGYTALPNPCAGIKGYAESGRDAYVDDDLMARAMEHAVLPLQFALRLAHLTGQRPADVYKMSETDIKDGMLFVRQGKTAAPLRFMIGGELKTLLDEMLAYKAQFAVRSLALLVTETGQPMKAHHMRHRFDMARDKAGIAKHEFQFRDLRAKTATEADDAEGTRRAQAILGHTTETMTTHYIRKRAGKKVRPLR